METSKRIVKGPQAPVMITEDLLALETTSEDRLVEAETTSEAPLVETTSEGLLALEMTSEDRLAIEMTSEDRLVGAEMTSEALQVEMTSEDLIPTEMTTEDLPVPVMVLGITSEDPPAPETTQEIVKCSWTVLVATCQGARTRRTLSPVPPRSSKCPLSETGTMVG